MSGQADAGAACPAITSISAPLEAGHESSATATHRGLAGEVWASQKPISDGHQRGHWKENKSEGRQQKAAGRKGAGKIERYEEHERGKQGI